MECTFSLLPMSTVYKMVSNKNKNEDPTKVWGKCDIQKIKWF